MDSADSRLIRQQFNRVYPVQIFSIVVVALNTFIDSIITSRLLVRKPWLPSDCLPPSPPPSA